MAAVLERGGALSLLNREVVLDLSKYIQKIQVETLFPPVSIKKSTQKLKQYAILSLIFLIFNPLQAV
jgi:hypothetical protein